LYFFIDYHDILDIYLYEAQGVYLHFILVWKRESGIGFGKWMKRTIRTAEIE